MNKEKMLSCLSEAYSREIISATVKEDHSAHELAEVLQIPIATVYRKLKVMEEAGIVKHVKTVINPHGNEEKFYRCVIKKFAATFKNGTLTIDLEEDLSDRFVRLWKIFSNGDLKERELSSGTLRDKGKTKHKGIKVNSLEH